MSDSEARLVACPRCGDPTPVAPETVIREGSSLLPLLFQSKLNRFPCAHCGDEFLFETPILYRDDGQRYLIYFLPTSFVGNLDDALGQLSELYRKVFGDFSAEMRPTCTLATDRSQFIEKIAIHECGLDDRLIEYVKYQLFRHSPGLEAVRHELLFDFGASEMGEKICFIAFERETRRPGYSLEFAVADYEKLAAYFLSGEGLEELNRLFRPHYARADDLLF